MPFAFVWVSLEQRSRRPRMPPRRMRTRAGRGSASRGGARTRSAARRTRWAVVRRRAATPRAPRLAVRPAAGVAVARSTASAPCAWTTGSRWPSWSPTRWRRRSVSRWWCPSGTAARTWRSSGSASKRRAGASVGKSSSEAHRGVAEAGAHEKSWCLDARKGVEHYWKVFVVEQFDEQLFNRRGARELGWFDA